MIRLANCCRVGFAGLLRGQSQQIAVLRLSSALPTTTADSKILDDSKKKLYKRIAIKVKGHDFAVLDSYVHFATKAAKLLDVDISGKISLPTQTKKFTLLKSSFIFKKHRVQYELRTHSRMLQIKNITGVSADVFLEYLQRNLPAGVNMHVYQEALEAPPPVLSELLKRQKKDAAAKKKGK
ncbi:small ribosomal subunit protein uS10m-like [Oscarella lobularis]|uniref:small ribosomal subunit protein uS10m-like n=1 Tax=Oscarella lobularis TaxID=121494 RepID=UPI0033133364